VSEHVLAFVITRQGYGVTLLRLAHATLSRMLVTNPLRFTLSVLLTTSLVITTGCASLSEQECRDGDWSSIGYRDGQNGRPLSRLDEHRKACLQYGMAPDARAYGQARERGLNFYCTPANGLAVGRRGEYYAGVCPSWAETGFIINFNIGRDIYEARQRLERLENDQRALETRLNKASEKGEVIRLSSQLRQLRMERDFAWDELRRREYRADGLHF
jgi:hypothetical protein